MKVTTTLVAVVGTLALLTPLSSAAAVAENAVNGAELEPRSSSHCHVQPRKHHEKNRKKASNAKNLVKAATTQRKKTTQRKTSTKKPSSTKKATTTSAVVRAATTTKKTTTTTKKTTSTTLKKTTTSTANRGTTTTKSTTSTKPSSTTPASTSLSTFQQQMLDIHNVDRAAHSASPLVWDTTVAAAAASWAAGCKWAHTPNNPYGQNIAAGTWSTFGAKDATDLWYDEYKLYDFDKGEYSDATGHFTQMVWKGSKKLGCALQKCTAQQMGLGSSGSANYVVCNYDPPGNWIGEFKENVSKN